MSTAGVLLTNCTVVDGRVVAGVGPVPDAAVWVRRERIAAAGPASQVRAQATAAGTPVEVDLDGAYLTPGLVNMHTHLSLSLPGRGGAEVRGLGPHDLALYMADGARRTLHAWGRKVTAHAGPADAIARAVERGLDCVEYGYQLTAPVAGLMARRGTALVPTLLVTRCKEFFDELAVPGWMSDRALAAGPRHLASYALALAAGVEVLLGSDMPPFWPFQGTTATVRELEHLSEHGLGPVRALYAGTLGPVRWLGAEADLGTVQPGRYADLIALDADPLADASAFRTVRWVMRGGRVVRDDRAGIGGDRA